MARANSRSQPNPQQPPQPEAAPQRIRLLRPYGFYDEGVPRFWRQDALVEHPDDIAILIERGASVDVLE